MLSAVSALHRTICLDDCREKSDALIDRWKRRLFPMVNTVTAVAVDAVLLHHSGFRMCLDPTQDLGFTLLGKENLKRSPTPASGHHGGPLTTKYIKINPPCERSPAPVSGHHGGPPTTSSTGTFDLASQEAVKGKHRISPVLWRSAERRVWCQYQHPHCWVSQTECDLTT